MSNQYEAARTMIKGTLFDEPEERRKQFDQKVEEFRQLIKREHEKGDEEFAVALLAFNWVALDIGQYDGEMPWLKES
jgi:nitrogen fixation-related uncharacterized protein